MSLEIDDIVLALGKKYFDKNFDKEGADCGEYWQKRKMLDFEDIQQLLPSLMRDDYPQLCGYHYMYNKNEMFLRLNWMHENKYGCNPKYIIWMEDDKMKFEDV